MKYFIPEISWHNRDPVLSVDFQPKQLHNNTFRLATGGTDSHVVIWHVNVLETGAVNIEVAADLTRHQKAVNIVRWSPNGELLASGDDESIIFIWKQRTDKDPPQVIDQNEEQYQETWNIYKTLRGHLEDVLDISWCSDSVRLASGSVDNKVLLWNIDCSRYSSILADHKGFVQGVTWDPRGQFLATLSTDRVFRAFDLASKRVVSRSSKSVLRVPADHPLSGIRVQLYHDDTLQTFFRRLHFSPDGMLIAVPCGRVEPDNVKPEQMKPLNAVYIYTRYSLKMPACVLPCGESPALVVRWSPIMYRLRSDGPIAAFPLGGRRMVLAVATGTSVLIYDTQQKTPIAMLTNTHYTRLTDLTWSQDGKVLMASSTDGFCSVIVFNEDELGERIIEDKLKESEGEPIEIQQSNAKIDSSSKTEVQKKQTSNLKLDSFIKFKTSEETKEANKEIQKTPIKIDNIEEVAMSSWADDSNTEPIKSTACPPTIVIEDSEDIKLVYEETVTSKSPENVENKNTVPSNSTDKIEKENDVEIDEAIVIKSSDEIKKNDVIIQKDMVPVTTNTATANITGPSPKTPRRVTFLTLSSPKNSKKKL